MLIPFQHIYFEDVLKKSSMITLREKSHSLMETNLKEINIETDRKQSSVNINITKNRII